VKLIDRTWQIRGFKEVKENREVIGTWRRFDLSTPRRDRQIMHTIVSCNK